MDERDDFIDVPYMTGHPVDSDMDIYSMGYEDGQRCNRLAMSALVAFFTIAGFTAGVLVSALVR